MRTSKFTPEQMVHILRQAEGRVPVVEQRAQDVAHDRREIDGGIADDERDEAARVRRQRAIISAKLPA
jgi:hypothetical protein